MTAIPGRSGAAASRGSLSNNNISLSSSSHQRSALREVPGDGDFESLEDQVMIDLRSEPPLLMFRDTKVDLITSRTTKRERFSVRLLDVTLASVALAGLFPLMIVIGLVVKATSRGPVLYRSHRETRDGKPFAMFKFRTMVVDADEVLAQYLADDPDAKERFERHNKFKKDPRVTRHGRLLRTLSLDELPQVVNVLRGEMSIVGPRPRLDWESSRFGSALGTVERVKGGMTGQWQVSGRTHLTFEERLALEVEYATTRSLRGDLRIIARTAVQLGQGSPGAY